MPFVLVLLALFTDFIAANADEENTYAEQLAEMFSPILILAEETGGKWGDIKIIKPEPVEIMGAQSAENLRFFVFNYIGQIFGHLDSYLNWDPPLAEELGSSKVFFSQNLFAFFVNGSYSGDPPGDDIADGNYLVHAYFDYPGTTPQEWNDAYTGSGARAGANFSNTAYVHIYQRTIEQYQVDYDPVTIIQYFYFYPYNDWWNNHEGDWQSIDVVVSSNDPNTAEVLGVEYRFHGAWLNYYKDYAAGKPGLTSRFVFDPQTEVKLSPGPTRNGLVAYTHPVVYVGAGSHAAYPVGGKIKIYREGLEILPGLGEPSEEDDEVRTAAGGDHEYMTHTGKILSTQSDDADTTLWESYELVMLPEPALADTSNMGLDPDMSWLGARIRWGTPVVSGPGSSSPEKGPYDSDSLDWGESKGWGELKFFEVGKTGPDWVLGWPSYDMHHTALPSTYHHWAIIGDETWSGTVSLVGDVVVFPGATLTIEAGTSVTFSPNNDRHRFSPPESSDDPLLAGRNNVTEIFVYGTLKSEGTSTNPVVLGGSDATNTVEHWGGIRVLGDGQVDLGDHTAVRNAKPYKPVFVRRSSRSSPVSVSVEWQPTNDPIISYQTRMSTDGTTWPAWNDWTEEYGEGGTYRYTETGLREVKDYWLSVRAVNKTPFDPGDVYVDSDSLVVKMRTLGAEDAGEVVLEPTSPRVGQPVQATLTDPDGYLAGSVWTWESRPVDGQQWTALTGSEDAIESSLYTPEATDLHLELRARVSYRDGHSTNTDTAESAASAAVEGNQAPTITGAASVSYTENDTSAVGSYTASDPDGHAITWLALAGADASHFEWTGAASDPTRTLRFKAPPDYETKSTYRIALKVKDHPQDPLEAGVDALDPDASLTTTLAVTVTVEDVAELTLGPPGPVAVEENDRFVLYYEGIHPDGAALTWALSGADKDRFALGELDDDALAKGAELRPLEFAPPPNYEQPTDQGANNIYEVTITVRAGSLSASVDVTVTVGDADDAGVITFSPRVPKAGQPITATLTDEDGDLKSVIWGWDNVEPSAQAGVAAIRMTSTVLVPNAWVGDAIRVLVFYADAFGPGKEAEGQTAVVEADVPAATGDLTATGGNGQVVVTWTTPDDHGAAISGYAYRSSDDGGSTWDPDWTNIDDSSKDTTEHTVLGLTNGTEYTLEIRAVNSAGPGAAARATATPFNQPPTLTGPDTPDDFAENGTGAIASYTASDPEGDALTWTLSGADKDRFAWGEGTTTRPLQFKQPPNYEQPTDQDDNNDYEVTVQVSDGAASATIAVTVTVANANDPGVITLSTTTPRANQSITATLADEDGVTGTVAWNDGYWSTSNTEERGKSDAKAANGTPNLTHTFTMSPDKVGWRFQAYAHYTDKFGSDSAQSASTDPIGEDNRPPCSPTAFEATGSDEQVALSWNAPTGTHCGALTRYEYRYTKSGSTWPDQWTGVGTTTSKTVTDLTNGTTYNFELRAARLL